MKPKDGKRMTPKEKRERWPTESECQDHALSAVHQLIANDRDARVTIRECLERIEWLENKLTKHGLSPFGEA